MVVPGACVELAGLLRDQRGRQIEQFGIGLGICDIAEIVGRAVHLFGIAQHLHHDAAPARLEADQHLLAAHRQLPQAHLARLPQRLAQHDVCFFGQIIRRHDVVRLFIIQHVDCIGIDELHQFQRPLRLQLDRFDLLIVEQHVIALGDFEALDDLVAINRPDPGHDLFIRDRLARRFVDLAKADRRAGLGGGEYLDRDRHQSQPDLALPIRACRHVPCLAPGPGVAPDALFQKQR